MSALLSLQSVDGIAALADALSAVLPSDGATEVAAALCLFCRFGRADVAEAICDGMCDGKVRARCISTFLLVRIEHDGGSAYFRVDRAGYAAPCPWAFHFFTPDA
jgi:hypothetical protein